MTRKKNSGHRRMVAILLANLTILALGIQAARMPVAAGSAPPTPSTMSGMVMSAPAIAQQKVGPVVMLHRRVVQVSIANYAFSPARLVVSPGTRIVWTNKDGDPHTVDSTKGLWSSEALDTDSHFARVFKTAGTFAYYCSIHPFMHGTIIVKK